MNSPVTQAQRQERTHTPGPWRAESTGAGEFAIRAPAPGPNNAFRIATVKHRGGDEEANARLIAAAPDMLTALKLVQQTTYQIHASTLATVEAAIAKAEGREP